MPKKGVLTRTYFSEGLPPTSHAHKINSRPEILIYAASKLPIAINMQQLTIENILTCLNTNFQKREGKLWTYTYADNTKAQIDYVFINKNGKIAQ